MNSSGIKRGLAVSAVSALAVAGIPALASSASAAAGDTITVTSTGPARNGGDLGAEVVLRVKDGTVDPADLALTSTSSAAVDSQNTADVNAEIVSVDAAIQDTTNAAYEFLPVHIAVTTSTVGETANFRIIDNDGANTNALEASEARASVSITTAGEAASISVSPSNQSTAQGIETGDYTVTVKDAQGRTTQLQAAESIALTEASGDVVINESGAAITAEEIADGTDTFTVTPDAAATPLGARTINLNGPGSVDTTAKVTITAAADISSANMVDIVTGADDWDGFGGGSLGGTTEVRVDQGSIRIDIKGSTANGTVSLNVDGDSNNTGGATDVTFGGKKSTTVSTVLDSDGNGTLTITPDQFSVQTGDLLDVSGSFSQTIDFERAAPDHVEATQDPYFGQLKGSVSIDVTVVDQFGDPYTSGFVGAQRVAGPNDAETAPNLKPVDADGTTTFSYSDAKATNGDSDTIALYYFKDQFSNSPDATGATHIKWTTDGQGANFVTSIGGDSTEATTYDPAKHTVVPLADTDADSAAESLALDVDGAEPASTATLSVDGGALILAPGKDLLSEGKSSVTVDLDNNGDLATGYRLIGTKSGVVTLTVSAANRTETAKFTVAAETDPSTARNVTVSGPATVPSGTAQITYTAVITDAFGNPVVGFPRQAAGTDLVNVQVSGPGQFKDGDVQTDANGAIKLNVAVANGAAGDITIRVQGVNNAFFFGGVDQFGAAADRLTVQSTTDDAKGLPVSSDVATATTTVEGAVVPTEPVYPKMKMQGIDKGKRDVIKLDAVDAASGAAVTLFKRKGDGSLKRIKSAVLNDAGNFTFRVHDGNGTKATRYTVKLQGNDAVRPANKSRRIK